MLSRLKLPRDICEEMDVGVEASMKADIASYGTGISANAKMANSLTRKKKVKTLVAKCKVEFESKTIDHRSGLWRRLAVEASRYTEKEFGELFGDAYFYKVTKGSACYITVSIQENEKNATSDIDAALSATVDSINVSGKIDVKVQRHLEAFEKKLNDGNQCLDSRSRSDGDNSRPARIVGLCKLFSAKHHRGKRGTDTWFRQEIF